MRFGIFDYLDDGGVQLSQLFEERLKLIEACDRAGFYGYHLAEHHATPLGYAPLPGVFLSQSRNGPGSCGSGRWSTCCRCTIRCA